MTKRMQYPPCQASRCGIKVGWRSYADKTDADKCAEAARHNAEIDRADGFDFGYNAPGSISQTDDGLFEVCIP